MRETTGRAIGTVTADAGYAYSKVFRGLERRRIDPVIPTRKDPSRSPVPLRHFRYDARHHLLKCPRGKILHPVRRLGRGQVFLSRVSDCGCCPLKGGCLPASRANKEVVVPHDYPALLRARRGRARWSEDDQRLYQRHLWRSEGFHGEAKTWHGLGRAIRRGLDNMKIQAYLTGDQSQQLAAALRAVLWAILGPPDAGTAPSKARPVPNSRTSLPTGAAA